MATTLTFSLITFCSAFGLIFLRTICLRRILFYAYTLPTYAPDIFDSGCRRWSMTARCLRVRVAHLVIFCSSHRAAIISGVSFFLRSLLGFNFDSYYRDNLLLFWVYPEFRYSSANMSVLAVEYETPTIAAALARLRCAFVQKVGFSTL